MLFWFFLLLWYCLVQLCDLKNRHSLCSSNLVVKVFASKYIDVVQMESEIYSQFWIFARHCGMETNWHRWKRRHFFLENQSKLLVSVVLSAALNTIKLLVYLKTEYYFLLTFDWLKISWSDVDFFSLSFKSRCRKEKSDPEDDLFHIDNFSFPKENTYIEMYVLHFCLGGCQGYVIDSKFL